MKLALRERRLASRGAAGQLADCPLGFSSRRMIAQMRPAPWRVPREFPEFPQDLGPGPIFPPIGPRRPGSPPVPRSRGLAGPRRRPRQSSAFTTGSPPAVVLAAAEREVHRRFTTGPPISGFSKVHRYREDFVRSQGRNLCDHGCRESSQNLRSIGEPPQWASPPLLSSPGRARLLTRKRKGNRPLRITSSFFPGEPTVNLR